MDLKRSVTKNPKKCRGRKMLVKVRHIIVMTMIGLFIGMIFMGSKPVNAQSYIDELDDNWVQPVDGEITDTFGTRNGNHKGIDIAAPEGEKIVSVSDGEVTKSYYSNTYGHVVFVEHPEGYETVYAHLSTRMVEEGDMVKRGQTLGIIGNTGVSTGTHLHFELHEGEWTYDKSHALDPLFVFDLSNSTVHAEHDHKTIDQESIQKVQDSTEVKQKSVQTKVHSTSIDKSLNEQQEKNQQKKVITVREGDTLWGLSQNYKVTIKSLLEWNTLDSDVIYPGQELKVYLNNEKSYVVKAGDTLQSIAKEFSMDPEAIKKANRLSNELLHPQQVLLISKNE
jgi:LysM repeat protein